MSENHDEQSTELTYPVEIQLTSPNETDDPDQPMEHDEGQITEPGI